MNATVSYTAYQVTITDSEFQVKVAGRHTSHPMNWMSLDGYSIDRVKQAAAIQLLPVVFIDEDGTRHEHGVQFSAEAFERAAYRGYVSYGISMTDGYYAPISFDVWVKNFRKYPVEEIRNNNDFYPSESEMAAYLAK